jgi:5-amino-6-(5-phosphoribosylamino)uracil reductase
MVEGGRRVLTQLLAQGLADELQLVVAPVFVGDARAPRFVDDGTFPFTASNRARLAEVRRVGDTALLRYALTNRCRELAEEM